MLFLTRKTLLGIDIGTASLKLAVVDEQARLLAIHAVPYAILNPQPGYAEIDASDLWQSLVSAMKNLLSEIAPDEISGIGISCLCPGLTAFSGNGDILFNPIIYSDRRSVIQAEFLKRMMPENEFFSITANTPMSGAMSGTSMLWVKDNMPEVYQQIAYFGHLNTMLGLLLTGKIGMDRSNASYTGLFDVAGTLNWSPLLCQKAGIPLELLPPILGSDEVLGTLANPEFLAMGLSPKTPVVMGGGDTACASLVAGVVANNDVCESVGTTNVLTVCVDRPRFNRAFINRCHVVDGTWIYQGAISHTGSSLTWFRDLYCSDLVAQAKKDGTSAYALMDAEADTTQPGANGVVFLPYMQGERSPVWDSYARGVFFGLSLDTSRADMIRAILESCGYGLRQLINIAQTTTEQTFSSFSSLGGGAKSAVWGQIKADITGKAINVLKLNDAAPIGAALLAGVGSGIFKDLIEASQKIKRDIHLHIRPNVHNQDVYNTRFSVYEELYPRIKDLFVINAKK
ncbi:MAG: xylulokinase [Acetivibrionales bacterium]